VRPLLTSRPLEGAELRSALPSILTGVWTTFGVATAGAIYLVQTWDRPNRVVILLVWALAVLTAAAIRLLPTERILTGRWREFFFFGWSTIDICLITVLAALDGGLASPFVLLFFLTVTFAALFYPLRLVLPVAALNLLGFGIVALAGGTSVGPTVWFFAACLAATTFMCSWQARNQQRQRDELARVSRSDPLTGCLNRRGFEQRLNEEFARSERSGAPFGIVLVDLDRFKAVNDRYGHAVGDRILVWTARTIAATVRPMDAVGRLGGDEFAVLLPGSSESDLRGLRGRIREALSERAACSAGVASFPVHGATAKELLQHADLELYEGKRPAVLTGQDLGWAAALAEAADSRLSPGQSERTAALAGAIAQHLGWEGQCLGMLRTAAMLQDVGIVAVPDRILHKPGPLDEAERRELQRHPVIGTALVGRVEGLEPVMPWIRHTHENFDGSGYPDGLSGDAIPLASRILHVGNAYVAMRTPRPYRDALSHAHAIDELYRGAGTQFDEGCVDALLAVINAATSCVEELATDG
jgi:diguanylate cyclase (GGDEF)-like protein